MKFVIPDHTGDSQVTFRPDQMADAATMWDDLVNTKKRTPVIPGENGAPGEKAKAFDPNVREYLFIQPMVGG